MNTIKLTSKDIENACQLLLKHLFSLLDTKSFLKETQWYELGVDYGNEIGTRTIAKGKSIQDLLSACNSITNQTEILKVGFDHTFLEIWDDLSGDPVPVLSVQPYKWTLFKLLTESIPESTYLSYGQVNGENETYFFSKEYVGENCIYKNEIAFVFFSEFPAYAGELYDWDEFDTRIDFLACEMNPDRKEQVAKLIFQNISWQSPSTYYEELFAIKD